MVGSLPGHKSPESKLQVIANMTVGKDVSALFADVVNCIQTDNVELKKLVYLSLRAEERASQVLVLYWVNRYSYLYIYI